MPTWYVTLNILFYFLSSPSRYNAPTEMHGIPRTLAFRCRVSRSSHDVFIHWYISFLAVLLICYAKATFATNPSRPIVHNCPRISAAPCYLSFQGYPHITHTTPQTTLHTLRMPPEDIHDHGPTQTGKNWPSILRHLLPHLSITKKLPPTTTTSLYSLSTSSATNMSRLYC